MTRLIVVLLLSATGVAMAQPVEGDTKVSIDLDALVDQTFARIGAPEVEKIARGTVRRARRAIAIGPTVGGWFAYAPGPEATEQAVSFGIGLEVFKIPIMPGVETFKALVQERLKAKVRQQIADRFKGVPPEPLEIERIVGEAFEEAKAEILGEKDIRSKTLERPRFSVGLEANRLFESELWMTRLRLGVGVWKLTVGGSLAAGFGDDTLVFVGPELSMHLLLAKGARSPVVDVFVRGDFAATHRDLDGDHVSVGARFLLDLI